MNKFWLSVITIGSFVVYGAWYRNMRTEATLPDDDGSAKTTVLLPSKTPTVSPTAVANNSGSTNVPATPVPTNSTGLKDGTYTGDSADAFYGFIQVQVAISGGKLTDVQFLQYPNDRSTSRMINGQAMPILRQEAIAAQSANVDIVSGATDSSQAFIQSLSSALAKAKSI
jgi:uncharacterized protein with FMN-binding domain